MASRRSRFRSSIVIAALVVVAAACGSDSATDVTSGGDGPTTTRAATAAPGSGADGSAPVAGTASLPSIDVLELASGDTVDLAALAEAGRPTLLWFWAPHCTFCRAEAPELLELSATHAGQLQILGIGAQDTIDEAYDFLDDTRTGDLRMIWDRSGQSWRHYGVTSQPTIVVLGADGEETGRWFRDFDADAILDAAGLT